jgi:hypothetical protein
METDFWAPYEIQAHVDCTPEAPEIPTPPPPPRRVAQSSKCQCHVRLVGDRRVIDCDSRCGEAALRRSGRQRCDFNNDTFVPQHFFCEYGDHTGMGRSVAAACADLRIGTEDFRELIELFGYGSRINDPLPPDFFVPGMPVNVFAHGFCDQSRCGSANTGAILRAGDNFCCEVQSTLRFLGFLLLFARIMVPLVIIIIGTKDFYKAIISNKQDEFGNQAKVFGKRLIAGVMIFFIPTILAVSFTFISNWSEFADEYNACSACLLNPSLCETDRS